MYRLMKTTPQDFRTRLDNFEARLRRLEGRAEPPPLPAGMYVAAALAPVLRLVQDRAARGLTTSASNTIFGPVRAAAHLGIPLPTYHAAIGHLVANGYITYRRDPGKRLPSTYVPRKDF